MTTRSHDYPCSMRSPWLGCLGLCLLLALGACGDDSTGGPADAAGDGDGTSGDGDGDGDAAGDGDGDLGGDGGGDGDGDGDRGGDGDGDGDLGGDGDGDGDADAGCAGACPAVICNGTIMIASQDAFADFLARGCTEVEGSLRITNITASSLAGVVVQRVGGDLFVSANATLTSLDGLQSVGQVGGDLRIVNNATLGSLDALQGWASDVVAGSLSIFSNPALPQCEVDALDAQLSTSCDNCGSNGNGACL
jgi:hypothetical protein